MPWPATPATVRPARKSAGSIPPGTWLRRPTPPGSGWVSVRPPTDRPPRLLPLRLLLARKQPRERFGRRDVAVEHVAHGLRDRQFETVAVGKSHHFIRGLHRLDHLAALAHRILQ